MSVKSSTELMLYVVLTMPTLNKAYLFIYLFIVPRPGKVPGYNRILKGTGVPHSSIERATNFLHGTKLRLLFCLT